MATESPPLGVARGAALYVGALVGPGVLLVPSLAAHAAGPAAILAWAGLLVLSAPLAVTFAALGMRLPGPGGVAAYVREGLGRDAAHATGACFLTAVVVGAPAVALIGGFYVADLSHAPTSVAVAVALAMLVAVLGANGFGLRVSSGLQLGLSALLVAVIALAVGVATPSRLDGGWSPFAPHGWRAVGTAASLLLWLFIGWEAMAQFVGDFRAPRRDLPRAMGVAYVVIVALYAGLAVATITVTAGDGSRVPLADLLAVGFGTAGRTVTAVLAVVLTMGTMNVYLAGGTRLAVALAREGALPASLAGGTRRERGTPPARRPWTPRGVRAGRARRRSRADRRPRPRDVGVLRRRLRPRARCGGADPDGSAARRRGARPRAHRRRRGLLGTVPPPAGGRHRDGGRAATGRPAVSARRSAAGVRPVCARRTRVR